MTFIGGLLLGRLILCVVWWGDDDDDANFVAGCVRACFFFSPIIFLIFIFNATYHTLGVYSYSYALYDSMKFLYYSTYNNIDKLPNGRLAGVISPRVRKSYDFFFFFTSWTKNPGINSFSNRPSLTLTNNARDRRRYVKSTEAARIGQMDLRSENYDRYKFPDSA